MTASTNHFTTCGPLTATQPAAKAGSTGSKRSGERPWRRGLTGHLSAIGSGLAAIALAACSTGAGIATNGTNAAPGQATRITETQSPTTASLANTGPRTKVALLLPLSAQGQTAQIATGLKQAAELALFDRNSQQVQLSVKDTQGTADGATAAAQAAIADGAKIILGPLFSGNVAAVKPVAQAAGIPVIAFSNNAEVAGQGTYLLSFQAHQDVDRIVNYALSQGRRNFAALIPNDVRGQQLATLFRSRVEQGGGRVIALATYPPGANGMLEKAQELFETVSGTGENGAAAADGAAILPATTYASPIDAVFIPGGPEVLPTLDRIIRYTKVDTASVRLIGTGSWDFPSLSRYKSFAGGWYPSPAPSGWKQFAARYSQTYNSAPPRIATFAYDAVSLVATLTGQTNSANAATEALAPQRLTDPSGFAGVDGLIRLRGDGLSDRGLAIMEVSEAGSRVIDGPPRAFGTAARTQTASY